MVDPVAFSLLSEVWVLVLHPLDHHDREVIYGVSRGVEMGSHWFLELLVANVTAVRGRDTKPSSAVMPFLYT